MKQMTYQTMTSILISLIIVLHCSFLVVTANLDKAICEFDKYPLIGVADRSFDRRLFMIGHYFYEYDYNYKYVRRGDIFRMANDFDSSDVYYDYEYDLFFMVSDDSDRMKRITSGFYIPPVVCDQGTQHLFNDSNAFNCSEYQTKFGNHFVSIVFYLQTGKNSVRTKRLFRDKRYNDWYNTVENCKDTLSKSYQTNAANNGSDQTNKSEFADNPDYLYIDIALDPHYVKQCGPYDEMAKVAPEVWLTAGLQGFNGHKFTYLPLLYDSETLTLYLILNKEYEIYGTGLATIRELPKLLWKRLGLKKPTDGWNEVSLPNDYTYLAFVRKGSDVYLVAQDFSTAYNERIEQFIFGFDPKTKKVEKRGERPLQKLFGCAPEDETYKAFIVLGTLLFFLVVIIIVWIAGCYWFYSRFNRDIIATVNLLMTVFSLFVGKTYATTTSKSMNIEHS